MASPAPESAAPEPLPMLPPPTVQQAYPDPVDEPAATHEQTTLLQNEDESFALAPVDASALRGEFVVMQLTVRC